jgi:hypothetical protein
MWASWKGHVECFRTLVEAGASTEAMDDVRELHYLYFPG